eukprot:5295203-Prymnesium_polylepis.2
MGGLIPHPSGSGASGGRLTRRVRRITPPALMVRAAHTLPSGAASPAATRASAWKRHPPPAGERKSTPARTRVPASADAP